MTDFFESFSDEIEGNAGAYAALGGLAALKGQQVQKESLNDIKDQLAKIENKQEREAEIKRSLVKFEEHLDSYEDNVNSKEQRFQLACSLDFKKNHFRNTLKFRDTDNTGRSPSELLSDIESIKYARLLEKKAQSYDLILDEYNEFYINIITALKNTCFNYNFLFEAFESTNKSKDILEYFTYENDTDITLPDDIFDTFKKELEFTDERNKLVISDNHYYAFLHILCDRVSDPKNYKILGFNDLQRFYSHQFVHLNIRAKKIALTNSATASAIYSFREAKVTSNLQNLISFSLNKEDGKNNISPWEKDEFLIDVKIADNIKCAAFNRSVFKKEFDKIIGIRKASELRSAINCNKVLQRFDALSVLESFIANARSEIVERKRLKRRNIISYTAVGALAIPVLAILIVHTCSFKTIPYISDKLDGFIYSKAGAVYNSYKITNENIKQIESSYNQIFSNYSDLKQSQRQELQSTLAALHRNGYTNSRQFAIYEQHLEECEKVDVTKKTDDKLSRLISEEKSIFEEECGLRYDSIIPANNLQKFRMNLASTSNASFN